MHSETWLCRSKHFRGLLPTWLSPRCAVWIWLNQWASILLASQYDGFIRDWWEGGGIVGGSGSQGLYPTLALPLSASCLLCSELSCPFSSVIATPPHPNKSLTKWFHLVVYIRSHVTVVRKLSHCPKESLALGQLLFADFSFRMSCRHCEEPWGGHSFEPI
jgi:hypothetical protein